MLYVYELKFADQLISFDSHIFFLFRSDFVCVKCRTAGAGAGADQRAFFAADQAAQDCAADGSGCDVNAVAVTTVKTRFCASDITNAPVSINNAPRIYFSLLSRRRIWQQQGQTAGKHEQH